METRIETYRGIGIYPAETIYEEQGLSPRTVLRCLSIIDGRAQLADKISELRQKIDAILDSRKPQTRFSAAPKNTRPAIQPSNLILAALGGLALLAWRRA